MILLASLHSGSSEAADPVPTARRIPVLAWLGPPAEQTTPERYRELADAGFTDNFSSFPTLDAMSRALDVAHAAGIRQFVAVPELASDPEGTARRFKDHPALAGYHLRDEPAAADFAQLAAWAKRIQSVDPAHGCYLNLFPNYATAAQLGTATYQEHVDRFLAEVPVPYLSFDHYPITGAGLRPGWYENLEIISRAARKAGIPFWAFALAVAHDPYPIARLEHLRLQVFSNLAYGAQCIQYFTYWTPESTVWNFHQAPIERDGKHTPVYGRVTQVNREIRALSPVFSGSKVLQVGHTGTRPRGTHPFKPERPVQHVETPGGGAVVSLLSRGTQRFLVIVNRDYTAVMPLEVTLDGTLPVTEVRRDGSRPPVKGRRHASRVAPGDVNVLTWETGRSRPR